MKIAYDNFSVYEIITLSSVWKLNEQSETVIDQLEMLP